VSHSAVNLGVVEISGVRSLSPVSVEHRSRAHGARNATAFQVLTVPDGDRRTAPLFARVSARIAQHRWIMCIGSGVAGP
jgi:hypothetical protein